MSSLSTANQTDGEELPLLPTKNHPKSFRDYLKASVDRSHADIILLLGYLGTGLLDGSATLVWGAFVSMQTGNSIYLGLGLVDPTASDRWIKSAVSIISFCIGSFAFARFHRAWGDSCKRSRAVLAASFGIQFALTAIAAIAVHFTPVPKPGDEHDLHWHVLIPIALVAMQSAGQTSTSRALEYGFLTSTVLTTIYCDLFSDHGLFATPTSNPDRNRRLSAPIFLIAGAALAGLWAKTAYALEGAIWTAAVLKGVIAIGWLWWKEERTESEDE